MIKIQKPLRLLALFSVSLFILILSCSVAFASPEGAYANTNCENNICTTEIYTTLKNVYEGGEWKPIESVQSLKDYYYIIYREIDKNYKVEVIDFNYTSVTLKLESEGNVPLNILDKNTLESNKEIIRNYKSGEEVVIILTLNDNFNLDSLIKFGDNSTLLEFAAGSGVIGDVHVHQGFPDTNQDTAELSCDDLKCRRSYIQWNLSTLPSGVIIDGANMSLYFKEAESANAKDASVYEMYCDDCFGEVNLTWNNQPCGVGFDDSNVCNLTFEDGQDLTNSYGWYLWDIEEMVSRNLEGILTIVLRSEDENCGTGSEYKMFHDSEYAVDVNLRPVLNITYTVPVLGVVLISPTNTTYNTFNISVTFNAILADSCWWKLDSNANVTSCDNTTMIAGNGFHTFNVTASNATANVTEQVNFTVDAVNFRVMVFDESNLTALPFVNITLDNEIDTENYTNVHTNETYYNITTDVLGEVTIRVRKNGYSERDYEVTLSNTTLTTLNAYITEDYETIVFLTVDTTNNFIANVDFEVQKEINGSDVVIASGQTDIAGGVTLYLNDDATHDFTFSRTGYSTNSFSWTPDSTRSPYYIQLNRSVEIDFDAVWENIKYWFAPSSGAMMVNNEYDLQFYIHSSDGALLWFAMNVSHWNGTQLYFANSTSAYGGTLNFTLNATYTDNLTLYGLWQKTVFDVVILQQNYSIINITTPGFTFQDVINALAGETHGINQEAGTFLYIIILALAMSAAGIVAGMQGAGAVGVILLIPATFIGIISPLLFAVIIITIASVYFLRR